MLLKVGVQPKKSLGQNFLVCQDVIDLMTDKIKEAAGPLDKRSLAVLEVGPGLGALTEKLFTIEELFKKIYLVEKDDKISDLLKKETPSFLRKKVEIHNEDFLLFELSNIKHKKYLAMGSLPYNVAKKIIEKLLTSQNPPEYSIFIIQKEVAESYSAISPKMTYLSSFAGLFADIQLLRVVPPECFKPKPNVESAIIEFRRSDRVFAPKQIEELKKLIRSAFSQPRKTLFNNLRETLDEETLEKYLLGQFGHLNVRPHELQITDWLDLAQARPISETPRIWKTDLGSDV